MIYHVQCQKIYLKLLFCLIINKLVKMIYHVQCQKIYLKLLFCQIIKKLVKMIIIMNNRFKIFMKFTNKRLILKDKS